MDGRIFSDLVSAIYDAAIDQSLWPHTLGLLCGAFGFRKATIDLNRVPAMTNLFNFHYGIDEQQAATMVGQYRAMPEVWGGIAAVMTRPIDRPWIVSRIISAQTLKRTDYYRNWVGPMALVDGAAIVLARGEGLFGSMRLATDARLGLIDDALIEALTLLLPHCQRAARINGLLDGAKDVARDFEAVIDALAVPVVLVSSDCAVVHANARAKARLQVGSILSFRHGRLISSLPGIEQAISESIRLLSVDHSQIPGRGSGMVLQSGIEPP
ncbi:hypothetical protein AB2M62_01685 [Sphingomonas sp. MMS12-HWE2-04]|uniref:hypothetical protein n=1 Tax=Sphingomonas sp. MMS12-HWE2-04 TaxID=3234199 RepID=UPI00384D9B36